MFYSSLLFIQLITVKFHTNRKGLGVLQIIFLQVPLSESSLFFTAVQGIELGLSQTCVFLARAGLCFRNESPRFPCGIYLENRICVDFRLSFLRTTPQVRFVQGEVLQGAAVLSMLQMCEAALGRFQLDFISRCQQGTFFLSKTGTQNPGEGFTLPTEWHAEIWGLFVSI